LKVVVDTSALVSALVFPGGAPEQVYRLAIEGRITMVTSPPLLAELGRVLTAKLGWQDDYVRAAIAQIVRISQVVEPVEQSASSRKTPTMIVPSRPRRLPRRPSSSRRSSPSEPWPLGRGRHPQTDRVPRRPQPGVEAVVRLAARQHAGGRHDVVTESGLSARAASSHVPVVLPPAFCRSLPTVGSGPAAVGSR
jgi:hypothetical protein